MIGLGLITGFGVFNAVNQQVYKQREGMFNDPANRRKLDYYLKDLGDWSRFCGVIASGG